MSVFPQVLARLEVAHLSPALPNPLCHCIGPRRTTDHGRGRPRSGPKSGDWRGKADHETCSPQDDMDETGRLSAFVRKECTDHNCHYGGCLFDDGAASAPSWTCSDPAGTSSGPSRGRPTTRTGRRATTGRSCSTPAAGLTWPLPAGASPCAGASAGPSSASESGSVPSAEPGIGRPPTARIGAGGIDAPQLTKTNPKFRRAGPVSLRSTKGRRTGRPIVPPGPFWQVNRGAGIEHDLCHQHVFSKESVTQGHRPGLYVWRPDEIEVI